LLIAGASRNARDNDEKRPLDHAYNIEDEDLRKQLVEML